MYIRPTDENLYRFLEKIEEQGMTMNDGKLPKGYAVDQIKQILRVWSKLSDIYGETDIMSLSMTLAAGIKPPAQDVVIDTVTSDKPEEVEEIDDVQEEDVPLAQKLNTDGLDEKKRRFLGLMNVGNALQSGE